MSSNFKFVLTARLVTVGSEIAVCQPTEFESMEAAVAHAHDVWEQFATQHATLKITVTLVTTQVVYETGGNRAR